LGATNILADNKQNANEDPKPNLEAPMPETEPQAEPQPEPWSKRENQCPKGGASDPNMAYQEPNYEAYLSGFKQDPLMPNAPSWNDLMATFNLVAQVRMTNPHLADYLMLDMSLALQAVYNPIVQQFMDTNPNVAQACILSPRLAHLLWNNPQLASIARCDLMINIICRVSPSLAEYLLSNPTEAAMVRRNWLDCVQLPHYDLYEMAKRECSCACKNAPPNLEDILSDVDLDELDLGLNLEA
jgi:hypothetical protein